MNLAGVKADRRQPNKKPAGWRTKLALVACSGAVALIAAEVGARAFLVAKYKGDEARYLASTNRLFDPCPDREYEYRTRPNLALSSAITPGTRLTTNSQGFRGNEFARHKASGCFRVAFYGDSFTFGIGVGDEDTFPYRLGQSPNLEVLNLGVSGYGTVQELALMSETLDMYHPDLVVLSYFLNDAQPHYSLARHPRWEFKHARAWAWEWAKYEANDLLALSDVTFRFDCKRLVYSSDWTDGFRDGSLKWQTCREALREMRELCRSRNTPFLLLVLPTFNSDFTTRNAYPLSFAHDKVVHAAEQLGIPSLDLLPEFIGADASEFVVDRDGHPNAKGHARIASRARDSIAAILAQSTATAAKR